MPTLRADTTLGDSPSRCNRTLPVRNRPFASFDRSSLLAGGTANQYPQAGDQYAQVGGAANQYAQNYNNSSSQYPAATQYPAANQSYVPPISNQAYASPTVNQAYASNQSYVAPLSQASHPPTPAGAYPPQQTAPPAQSYPVRSVPTCFSLAQMRLQRLCL